jgi:RHS repeat-associated protein
MGAARSRLAPDAREAAPHPGEISPGGPGAACSSLAAVCERVAAGEGQGVEVDPLVRAAVWAAPGPSGASAARLSGGAAGRILGQPVRRRPRDEIASVEHKTSGGATLLRMDYGYNAVHDRTYERFGASGSSGDGFEYDRLRRLTTAYMGSATPSAPSSAAYVTKIVYNMDDDGNRTSVVTTPYGQSAQTTSYTTNTLNQYTAVGSASPTYDSNGNLTNNGTYKFEYNYKNLITKVLNASTNAQIAIYRYDPMGRRVRKAVTGGITQRYIYSDVETIATYDGSNNWKQNFVFGQGIDSILMLEQADVLDYDGDSNTTEVVRSFYHRNALGSVMEITDASQAEAASYRYTPYGEMTITRGGTTQTSDPLGQHWGFTGRWHDDEAALFYFRARSESAETGRFVQRDPLGYRVDPSLFQYVRSAPTRLVDPLGLAFGGRDFWKGVTLMARAILEVGPIAAMLGLVESDFAAEDASKYCKYDVCDENAVRHCLWACYMTVIIGEEPADAIGHMFEEVYNPDGPWAPLDPESTIDLHNDHMGIDCAQRAAKSGHASKESCLKCCLNRDSRGVLITAGSAAQRRIHDEYRRRHRARAGDQRTCGG